MNKYVKDNVVIVATEKAYNLIYKNRGYKPFVQKEIKKSSSKKNEEQDSE